MLFWYTSALGMKRFRPHLAPMTTYTQTEQATSRAGWKLWPPRRERNRDTGLILPRVLLFLLLWMRKSPAFKRKISKAGLFFYTLFRSIFDGFKKSEGKFLLLELGKFKLQLNKFV